MLKVSLTLLMACVILASCGNAKEEEKVVISKPPLHEISSSVVWNNKKLEAITPVTAFDTTEDVLTVYPYNGSDRYVSVQIISVSENNLWKSITEPYINSANIVKGKRYSYVTLPNNVTYGYIPLSDESAYLVKSDCPSAYLQKVCEMLCGTST